MVRDRAAEPGRAVDALEVEDAALGSPLDDESPAAAGLLFATGATGLEPATSGVTGRRSNRLSYAPERR
jgi:hypothetical protein